MITKKILIDQASLRKRESYHTRTDLAGRKCICRVNNKYLRLGIKQLKCRTLWSQHESTTERRTKVTWWKPSLAVSDKLVHSTQVNLITGWKGIIETAVLVLPRARAMLRQDCFLT